MILEGRNVESGTHIWRFDLARERTAQAGFFVPREGASMANHLTPEELSKELGIDRGAVARHARLLQADPKPAIPPTGSEEPKPAGLERPPAPGRLPRGESRPPAAVATARRTKGSGVD